MSPHMLWTILLGFLAGVFVRALAPLGLAVALFLVMLAAALFVLGQLRALNHATSLFAVVFLCAACVGGARMHGAVLVPDSQLLARVGTTVSLAGVVDEESDVRDGSVRVVLSVHAITATTSTPVDARVLVSLPSGTAVAYGDRLVVSGALVQSEAFETGAGRSFDYPGYLAARGIALQLDRAHIVRRDAQGEGNPVVAAAIAVKQAYIRGTEAVLPEPHAGLADGIVVGDKRSVGPELSLLFQRVSLSHMVVLSGYNITVVAAIVLALLRWLPAAARSLGATAAIAFFVLASGGAANAVRAAGMAVIALYARGSGREFPALRVLLAVVAGMVAWNPYLLVFDPGFQLSALATAGLVVFSPVLARRLTWVPVRLGLREITAATLSTQITVLPLILWQNGLLSIVGLPANLLALAVVPLAMLASVVAAVSGMLLGSWGLLLAAPAYALLSYIIGVVRLFAAVPFAAAQLPVFSAWLLMPAYATLAYAGFLVHTKTAAADAAAVKGE